MSGFETDALKRKYENEEPVGVYGVSNAIAVLFFEPLEGEECDYVVCSSIVDIGLKDFEEVEAEYGFDEEDETEDGDPRAFVRYGEWKIYLDEVMRTNYPY